MELSTIGLPKIVCGLCRRGLQFWGSLTSRICGVWSTDIPSVGHKREHRTYQSVGRCGVVMSGEPLEYPLTEMRVGLKNRMHGL